MDGPESRPRSSILCRVWSQEGGRKVGEEEREKKNINTYSGTPI